MSTPFQNVSDSDLLKATLFNRCYLSETGCWEWNSHKRNGYGLFYTDSKTQSAHRVSYELFHGPIPAGLHILHSCDNPGCVNPDHLRAGTAKENMADREARGRRDVRGEQVGTSKLTEEQVRQIKFSTVAPKDVAAQYGIRETHVWRIRTGRSWAHITANAESVGVSHGY